jgi:predicted DNA-binding transcriptional regulator YafY
VTWTEEIKFRVISWGSKAQVLEPQSIREEIRIDTEKVLESYQITVGQIEEPVTA